MRMGSKAGLRPSMVAGLIAIGALVAPAAAKAPELAMLGALANGTWEVSYRDGAPTDRICVHNGRELIQLRHRLAECSRYVVDDKPNQVTVQYTCKGDGYGRTSIRRETGELVQIDSQGIEHGMPFHLTGEARRAGAC